MNGLSGSALVPMLWRWATADQKVEDDVMESLAITRCDFHGEWNYRIAPKTSES
jgi:hypothetical protein